jgi:hypothetical protein
VLGDGTMIASARPIPSCIWRRGVEPDRDRRSSGAKATRSQAGLLLDQFSALDARHDFSRGLVVDPMPE